MTTSNTAEQPQVLVIGAGIAGLAAAFTLHQAGLKVTVLEAGSRVGGRMTTDVIDGFIMDRGAQFLSNLYTSLIPLIRAAGLEADLRPISPCVATVRNHLPRRICRQNPLQMVSNGLLSPGDLARLGRFGFLSSDGREMRRLPLDNYAGWAEYDHTDAAVWCAARLGETVTEYILEPALQAYYFQPPEGTSEALARVLMGFNFNLANETLTLVRGLGSLPEALAAGLDVRLHTPAQQIEPLAEGVRVATASGDFVAQWVVLAATTSAVSRIYTPMDATERELLTTGYSSTLVINLAIAPDWPLPEKLRQVYGLAVPRKERDLIAAVAIESNKEPGRAPSGELLNVMLADEAGAVLLHESDADVVARILPELERYFPGVGRHIRFTHIIRWAEAEPRSPVGRSRAIAAYRRSRDEQRVLLAGDYMGMPFTDGAAETGIWAANHILGQRKQVTG
ncbi:MAG: FAD-dependent oxidoreductase [Anaerolineaceae bacterium]|nr:FAD-dependent oxidoreductase [Anaerolineaceae bacterium]